jgi:hypothetical protein
MCVCGRRDERRHLRLVRLKGQGRVAESCERGEAPMYFVHGGHALIARGWFDGPCILVPRE